MDTTDRIIAEKLKSTTFRKNLAHRPAHIWFQGKGRGRQLLGYGCISGS